MNINNQMNKRKYSFYVTLGIIIFTTVTLVMSIHASYNYVDTKDKIIEEMKNNSRNTIIRLEKNIANLISSYAVNEYDKLLFNELERHDIFAIVVKDYNMGEILGKKSYITGKIRDIKSNIIDYDYKNIQQNKELENSFYSNSSDITNSLGKKIGSIGIYISDYNINKVLNKIVKSTIIDTIIISFLLLLLLFLIIHFSVLKPISNINEIITNCDSDGVPIEPIPNSGTKEISLLSVKMNNMIKSIKNSREILKESENRLEYLLQLSPIAVRIAKNSGKNVIFSNNAYSKLLRIKNGNTLNMNPQDYYSNKLIYDEIVESLGKNESIYNKLVKLDVENDIVWALASYMNIDFDGEKSIIGWFYDVTKEKENEVELYKALELQTTIFDNSGYLIFRTDTNGIIQQVNKEVEKLLGYSSQELINKKIPEIIHLDSEVKFRAEEFSKELNQQIEPGFDVFTTKATLGLDNEYEWTYVTKEGNNVPVLLNVSALKNKDNEIYGYLGIAKDITEHKLMESQSRLASMGEMIGNIAHQWRQPLSVISTISSGVKVRNEFGILDISTIAEDMDHITQQTQYLSKTIDDFRDFIKNKNKNKKERISVLNTVNKVLSLVNASLTSNDIVLVKDLKEDILINGFENQLIQSFINIINNAKDAMLELDKDKDRLLFIESKKIDNDLVLSIKDNAGGIKEDIINRIFEPYFTTKHKSIGTGIGLSLVHQIITEHHDASIKVSNEKYEYNEKEYIGACFQITFKV